jgi:phage tail-like protein
MPTNDVSRWGSVATDPLRNFRFQVEFLPPSNGGTYFNPASTAATTGFSGGFTSVSGLTINTQAIAYREGGYNTTVHQIPGMTTFNPIVLSRGMVYGQDQAITWMRALFAAAAGDGIALGSSDFRLDLNIYVNDHPSTTSAPNSASGAAGSNTPRVLFRVHNAWISTLSYNDLNGTDNNILFEGITLVHEGLSVEFVDDSGAPYTGKSGVAPAAY